MANIREYWPEFLREIREFSLLAEAENEELNVLENELNSMLDDQFIETATERGIARREKILNIVPYGDDTLEDRRFRVAGKWMNRLPYTYRMLQDRLDALLGEGHYVVELNNEPYTLIVKIELISKRQFNATEEMLQEVVPANLHLIVELRYNQHFKLATFTHRQLAESDLFHDPFDCGLFGEPFDELSFDGGLFDEQFDEPEFDCGNFIGRTHEQLRNEVLN